MSIELRYQKQIVDDVKFFDRRSYAIKMSNRFIAGIPDLLIKVPDYEILFVEVKYTVLPKTSSTVLVETTAIQKRTLKVMAGAGLAVAVWVFVDVGKSTGIAKVGWDRTSIDIDPAKLIYRPKGKIWPIKELLTNPDGYGIW